MWARGSPEKGIVLFDYDPSGGGKIAKKLVLEFKGALQADAHRGYGTLDRTDLRLLGCMMHSRRRFEEAWVVGGKKPGLAADGLAMMRWIYEKEAKYKASGLTPVERKAIRDKELKPSLATMKEWAEANTIKVPQKSPVGNALHYLINEYDELVGFLADGRYEIDNGWLERMIRKFAIGRNNWLFCDTVGGAESSSLLYGLTITAKLNGHDPFKALTEIFRKIPDASTLADYEALTELLLSPSSDTTCNKKE
jgi:transposase